MKAKQRTEALKRMELLKLHENVIDDFKELSLLNQSELGGILYWVEGEMEKKIREWEEKTGNLVYHVIHDYTEFGELLSLLYVSTYEDEWETDREDIQDGYALAYVMNLTDDWAQSMAALVLDHNGVALLEQRKGGKENGTILCNSRKDR